MTNFILLVVLVTTQVLGDIWLSQGMKQFGEMTSITPQTLLTLMSYLFTSPWIWLGVLTLTFSMLVYFTAISRLDISYVLPIHASSYVLNALLAWLILGEQVSSMRWLATLMIAIGVFVIGWSESLAYAEPEFKKNRRKFKRSSKVFLFIATSSLTLPKVWLGTIILALADSAGDILTGMGIRQVGEIPSFALANLLPWVGRVVTNPLMVAGVGGNAIAFLMFIWLLSWEEISLVRPATAIGYAFSLLGARFILQEHISRERLLGIVIIGCGVATLSLT